MKKLILAFLVIILVQKNLTARSLMLGCWVPYWKTESAIETAKHHCALFDQISPFSFEVHPKKGTLRDPFKRKICLWRDMFHHCRRHLVSIIPTIYWSDTEQMHDILSDPKKRTDHINQIIQLVTARNFDGINIDYERVCSHDRDHYLTFLEQLSSELHSRKKELHICIEGRTSDTTYALIRHKPHPHTPLNKHKNKHKEREVCTVSPGKGANAVRYKKVLAECCDQIIIMGYGEWGRPYAHDKEHLKKKYYVSHASNQWVEQILHYALSFLPAHKVVLGIPTFGTEFKVANDKGKIRINKARNISYPEAIDLAAQRKRYPKRTHGGELAFSYPHEGEERYVCFIDSKAIKEKIDLAKKYRIKGIYMFIINGCEDSSMWPTLQKELQYSLLAKSAR